MVPLAWFIKQFCYMKDRVNKQQNQLIERAGEQQFLLVQLIAGLIEHKHLDSCL
jgi:hypothetical protein